MWRRQWSKRENIGEGKEEEARLGKEMARREERVNEKRRKKEGGREGDPALPVPPFPSRHVERVHAV